MFIKVLLNWVLRGQKYESSGPWSGIRSNKMPQLGSYVEIPPLKGLPFDYIFVYISEQI